MSYSLGFLSPSLALARIALKHFVSSMNSKGDNTDEPARNILWEQVSQS